MTLTNRTILFLATASLILAYATMAYAPQANAQSAIMLRIIQHSPIATVGDWTLYKPNDKKVELNDKKNYETDTAVQGDYRLIVDPPIGMTTAITVKNGTAVIASATIPRLNFSINNDEDWTVEITYTLEKSGKVSVGSEPGGIGFTITGPDGFTARGITPEGFDPMPVGMYTVEYDEVDGCPTPPKKSDRLENGKRITLNVLLDCDSEALRNLESTYSKDLEYVTMIDGRNVVTFGDVPIGTWFATYVHNVARVGVMNGYTDSTGGYTGEFGPSDNVTLAQLAKIAHKAAGLDETRGNLANDRAAGTWFESFYRSAENRYWIVFMNPNEDPARLATRAEVVGTIMQAFDRPRLWPKGQIFSDVQPLSRFAAAIETAAVDCLIGEYCVTGEKTAFHPSDPINRAEMAKILSQAMDVYGIETPEVSGGSR